MTLLRSLFPKPLSNTTMLELDPDEKEALLNFVFAGVILSSRVVDLNGSQLGYMDSVRLFLRGRGCIMKKWAACPVPSGYSP